MTDEVKTEYPTLHLIFEREVSQVQGDLILKLVCPVTQWLGRSRLERFYLRNV